MEKQSKTQSTKTFTGSNKHSLKLTTSALKFIQKNEKKDLLLPNDQKAQENFNFRKLVRQNHTQTFPKQGNDLSSTQRIRDQSSDTQKSEKRILISRYDAILCDLMDSENIKKQLEHLKSWNQLLFCQIFELFRTFETQDPIRNFQTAMQTTLVTKEKSSIMSKSLNVLAKLTVDYGQPAIAIHESVQNFQKDCGTGQQRANAIGQAVQTYTSNIFQERFTQAQLNCALLHNIRHQQFADACANLAIEICKQLGKTSRVWTFEQICILIVKKNLVEYDIIDDWVKQLLSE